VWADAADKIPDAKLISLQRARHWAELAEADLPAADKAKATVLIGQVSAKLSRMSAATETRVAVKQNQTPRKNVEPVVRRNFNTFRNEEVFKAQWKLEGSARWESLGLRMLENPVSLQSTFQLIDNWKMEIDAVYDGRELVIEVNKQLITLKPTRTEAVIVLERKGKKLTFALIGTKPTVSTISLPDDALAPSTVSIKLQGNAYTTRKEGMLVPRILVNGPVKSAE
jgi:hypothetical protein